MGEEEGAGGIALGWGFTWRSPSVQGTGAVADAVSIRRSLGSHWGEKPGGSLHPKFTLHAGEVQKSISLILQRLHGAGSAS